MKNPPLPSRLFSPGSGLRRVIALVIFVALVALVEKYIGWVQLLTPWRLLSPVSLIVAVSLLLFSYMLRAMRLYLYFRETRGHFLLCTKLMLLHNFFNNLLPMRSGEFSFPLMMAGYFDVPASRSLPALLWFRLLDLHTILILGLGAVVLYTSHDMRVLLPLLLCLPLPLLFYTLAGRSRRSLAQRTPGRLNSFLLKALAGLPGTIQSFWYTWLWTVINWAVKLMVFAWLMLQFADAPYAAALAGAITGDLTSVLPIHGIAGTGTYEAGVIAGLLPFGIGMEDALRMAVNLHLFILAGTILGGALAYFMSSSRRNQSMPVKSQGHE